MALVSALNGFEGRVELVGARAAGALFQQWSLRREGPGDDAWSLHAVLSYKKPNLLFHPKFKRRTVVKVVWNPGETGTWYEVKLPDGQEPLIEGDDLTIKGATLCRIDPTGRT